MHFRKSYQSLVALLVLSRGCKTYYQSKDLPYRNSYLVISALKIHISSETAAALQSFESFNVELRGELEIKVRRKSNVGWLLVIYYNEYFRARVS